MAVPRDNPYGAFNFQVTVDTIGGGDPMSMAAGFQEVSGLGLEVTIAEYRNGNEPENHTRKLNGMYKASDVTLKRGLIGQLDFFNWIRDTRDGGTRGDPRPVTRLVTIQLMDEAHTQAVMTWKLTNARPMKYTGATLNAKTGTDVAIEELVLACEKLDVE
jgi:phage tail-like protein